MRPASLTQPEVRRQILEVAERLFRAWGYERTTIADIARECGMSPANVYRFFESKKAVREAITEVVLQQVEDIARAIAAEKRSAAARLRKVVLASHAFTCEKLLKESQVLDLCTRAMHEQWGAVEAHIRRMRTVVRELIAEGMQSGEFARADLDFTETCVNNAITPFCHPVLVAQQFAKDQSRQAVAMGDFLVAALQAGAPGAAAGGKGGQSETTHKGDKAGKAKKPGRADKPGKGSKKKRGEEK